LQISIPPINQGNNVYHGDNQLNNPNQTIIPWANLSSFTPAIIMINSNLMIKGFCMIKIE